MHDHMSVTYGIHFNSILNSSRYFHVTEGLVMDVMHDVLESTLEYEVKELMKYFISDNVITISSLTGAVSSFPYGASDVNNKPSEISASHLHSSDHNDHKLRQNG